MLHPTKLLEALDPLGFEMDERNEQHIIQICDAKTEGKIMHKFGQGLHDKVIDFPAYTSPTQIVNQQVLYQANDRPPH